ncbi:MAG: thiol peroxidase [Acidobacteriota bacterium]
MSSLTFKNSPIETRGDFPVVGATAPDFKMVARDLSEISLSDFKGKKVLLNIFPSVDTAVCGLQLKNFSEKAAGLKDTVLLFVSLDLPFAFSRFCAAEGIENAVTASDFRYQALGQHYGVAMESGPLSGLYALAVLLLDEEQKVVYTELVSEVTHEPDYGAAIAAVG